MMKISVNMDYADGYKEGFAEGVKHAQQFIESQSSPNVIIALPATTMPPAWWCCSADYPNHDASCKNVTPPAEVDASTLATELLRVVEAVEVDWRFASHIRDGFEKGKSAAKVAIRAECARLKVEVKDVR